jgi:hypothetical protein
MAAQQQQQRTALVAALHKNRGELSADALKKLLASASPGTNATRA